MIDLDLHLDAIRAGNAEAFALWVAGAELTLRRSLGTFASRVDTEAVLQETLLRVWNLVPGFEREGANSLLRFAHRIARNLAIDEWRREKGKAPIPPISDTPVEPVTPDPFLRRAIGRCLEALPGRPRAAMLARLEDEGAHPDTWIAKRIGMKVNTFFQNIGRARRLMRACLEGRGVTVS